jgi:hypothetical protein
MGKTDFMVSGRIHARWRVRLSIARRGGWRGWLEVSGDFERGLEALASKTVIMPHIDAETRRGRDYVRVTLAMTIVAGDVAEALDGAWRAFRSPTTTGKIERFHGSLRRELTDDAVPFADLGAAQAAVDEWVHEYNTRRPHQAIGMAVPAERFSTARARQSGSCCRCAGPGSSPWPRSSRCPLRRRNLLLSLPSRSPECHCLD